MCTSSVYAVAVLGEDDRPLISVSPSDSLLEAVFSLSYGKVHRLLVVNPVTGNALHVLTYLRMLRFIHACVCKQISRSSFIRRFLMLTCTVVIFSLKLMMIMTLIVTIINKH